MSQRLATELEQFSAAILAVQQQLLNLLQRKRAVLTASDLAALEQFHVPEQEATERLQVLLTWRAKLLAKAQQAGLAAGTLTDVARRLGPEAAATLQRLEDSRKTAAALQRESWIHWILTNRCAQYYRDVIDRIAEGGRKSPTYGASESVSRGGTLLNASA